MPMFMTEEDGFACATHAVVVIVAFKAGQACEDGGVFFGLGFFGTKGVIGHRVKANRWRLIGGEGKRYDRSAGL